MPCKAANAAYEAAYRLDKAKGKQRLGVLISAVDARRRVRQLKSEGFTKSRIAYELGLKHPCLKLHTDVITVRKHLSIRRLARLHLLDGADGPGIAHP